MSKTPEEMQNHLRTAMDDLSNAVDLVTLVAAHEYCRGYAQCLHDSGHIAADSLGHWRAAISARYESRRAEMPEEWQPPARHQ
jgi:hypothetical protein